LLRDFQAKADAEICQAWDEGATNVMLTMATGGGKTVLFSHRVRQHNGAACLIAHRQELVGQAALALNREEVPHGIIAPQAIQKQIISLEMETHGRSFYQQYAPVRVAGVDTLIRHDPADRWLKQVGLVVQDEGHHVLRANKWGEAMALFTGTPRGLFVTAHAYRADGKGLGRDADGLVNRLVIGPHGRMLINRGFLCDYRLIAPPSDVDLSDVDVGPSGELNYAKTRKAVHKSKTIVGDVVKHYLRFAPGKLGITFAVDIEAATEIATAYRAAGIPAEIITAKTPLFVRGQLMRQFRAKQILQLVSVDVLGEGVDVPAVEVVSMARPTASFQLYAQQFGRALRLMLTDFQNANWGSYSDAERLTLIAASVKPKAIIIDHVQNYVRHGLPDVEQSYSMNRRERRSRGKIDDAIPLRPCMNEQCTSFLQPYPVVLPGCPVCGVKPIPGRRGTPEQVDGDLFELDPDVLRAMRGEVARIDNPVEIPQSVSGPVALAIRKRHIERQEAQRALREAWQLWQGWQLHQGRGEVEGHKRFFFKFGIDVLSAHALGAPDAAALMLRIQDDLRVNNIVEAK
jgi:DNA repair protein RadD